MIKLASFSRVPIEGRNVAKSFFRTRVHVACDFEFPPELGRIAVVKRIRRALEAHTEVMGLEPGTRFFFSKNAGQANAAWGDGGGFIMDRAVPGEQCTLHVELTQE